MPIKANRTAVWQSAVMFNTAFLKSETWGFPIASVEHIETHAAHVFLVGDRAFKIKKDVKLPYLDFSSIEQRRAVLAAELAINRTFAQDLYLDVKDVLGEPVLVMRRFASNALLSWKLDHGGIDAATAKSLADMAARAHELAPERNVEGAPIMMGLGAQLSRAFVDSPDIFPPAETLEFHALYEEALRRLKALLNNRAQAGLVRRCHGDMHCGNIIIEEGQPKLFDAIEFSEKIATIDVLYDLAFLLMDLWFHGERQAANIVLNRYLHLRRRQEDLTGLAMLPLFLSTRSGVRALVTADLVHELPVSSSMKPRGQALDSFRAAIAYLKPEAPVMICIGGLSGTGKSTVAQAVAGEIGAAPGAVVIRSDIERKALAGVAETDRLPLFSYSHEATAEVYDHCLSRAERVLKSGQSLVIDAVFAREGERIAAARLAQSVGVPFRGIWLEAPEHVLKDRVRTRIADASDANAEVVTKQLGYALGDISWHRADASGTPAQTLERVRGMLPSRSAARA
jgi:aminoglycoside phosphotransferase family enzyme/predicted kinase